jgi:hypothetical protein
MPRPWRVADDITSLYDVHTLVVSDPVADDQVLTAVVLVWHGSRSCAEVHRQ